MISDEWFASLSQPLAELARRGLEYLPSVLGAVLILVIGWLVARLLRAWTARSLARLNRLFVGRAVEQELKASGADRLASEAASLIVFWLVFLIFLAAAGEVLGLAVVTTGLSRLAQYLPNILGAVLVVLAGLVLANLARGAVGRAAVTAKLGYGVALGQSARVIILLVAGVIALDQLGVDSQLLIVSTNILIASVIGGTALAFALGSRTAVSNRGAEGIALMLSDVTRQQLSSSLLYSTIEVTHYARVSWCTVRLDVPEWKLSQLGTVAVSDPNRRFRREAAAFLCEIRWAGRGKQRQRARELLDQVAASGDPLLESDAACPVNPYRAGLAGVDP